MSVPDRGRRWIPVLDQTGHMDVELYESPDGAVRLEVRADG